MPSSLLSPLSTQVPIVDPETGNPTPYFQRMLQQLLNEKTATETIVEGNTTDITDLETDIANLSLDDLTDVDTVSTPPADGDGLVFDEASGLWLPGEVTSSSAVFKGCRLYTTTGTIGTMTWETEAFDTDGYHAANSSDIVILESGYIEVGLNLGRVTSLTDQLGGYVQLYRGGVAQYKLCESDTDTTGGDAISLSSGPVAVLAGDFLRASAYATSAGALDTGAGRTNFWMKVLAAPPEFSNWTLIATSTTTGVGQIDFTGLDGYNDLMLIGRAVTGSVSSFRGVLASVDNGSSYYSTSGNYIQLTTAGVESNVGQFDGIDTSSALARSFSLYFPGAGVNGAPKRCISTLGAERWFVASNSPINALRYRHSSGGNITGGTLYLYGR